MMEITSKHYTYFVKLTKSIRDGNEATELWDLVPFENRMSLYAIKRK